MKKQIAVITGLLTFVLMANAMELPNGVDAKVVRTKEENGHIVEAEVANSVVFETKYGSIPTKEKTKVCFYESGSLKSFHPSDKIDVMLKCGTFTISSVYNVSVDKPIIFDEEGNLVSAYLPYKKESLPQNVAETSIGGVKLGTQAAVEFHSNGTLKSASVPVKTVVRINGKLTPLAPNSKIRFYETGELMEYSPTESSTYYGIKTKSKNPLVLSESGKIISLIPANGEVLDMGEDLSFYFENNMPVEFYESGEFKKMTIDCGGKDFSYDSFKFLAKDENRVFVTFDYHEDGALDKAKGSSFRVKYGELEFNADSFETYQSGKLRTVRFAEGIPDKNKEGNLIYIYRRYYDENGNITAQVSNNMILLMEADGKTIDRQIYNTGYLADKNHDITETSSGIHSDSEIIFDENGSPTAYTVYENHDALRLRSKNPKIVEVPITE